MLAINQKAAAAVVSALPASQLISVTTVLAAEARRPERAGRCTPLLDHATEARRFFSLDARGMIRRDDFLAKPPGNDAVNVVLPNAPPTYRVKKIDRLRLSSFERHRLEQTLSDMASGPASGQAGAPAVLLEYLSRCDSQSAQKLLGNPAWKTLIDYQNNDDGTVLHMAIKNNLPRVVKRLMKFVPAPHSLIGATSSLGVTALAAASLQGNTELVQALLVHPAAVAQAAFVPQGWWNALIAASLDGYVPVARLLLATLTGGRQALAVDFRGRNALMFAAMHGHVEFAKLLLTHPSAQAQGRVRDENGLNALMLAVSAGHCAMVRLLLTHSATAGQVIEVAKSGDDALIIAARVGQLQMVRLLLADPMATILLDGETVTRANALTLAAQNGYTTVVETLLSAMTPEQAAHCDNQGRNALMLAARNGHAETVCLLLAHPNTQGLALAVDHAGLNALMAAAWRGRHAVVVALLNARSGLSQIQSIPNAVFDALLAAAMAEDITVGGLFADLPTPETRKGQAFGQTGLRLVRVATVCPPSLMSNLLPVMARIMAEKAAHA